MAPAACLCRDSVTCLYRSKAPTPVGPLPLPREPTETILDL